MKGCNHKSYLQFQSIHETRKWFKNVFVGILKPNIYQKQEKIRKR